MEFDVGLVGDQGKVKSRRRFGVTRHHVVGLVIPLLVEPSLQSLKHIIFYLNE